MLTSQQRERRSAVLYSRVSSRVGSVSYGHVVVLVGGAPDPVESALSPGERRRKPTLQHHVGPLHHVLHLVLYLTGVS